MTRPTAPPRAARRLVAWFAGADNAPYLLSDLDEEFQALAERRGRPAAVRWYWRQAITSGVPLAGAGLRRTRTLARLHVRDALRAFRRAPGLSAAIVLTLGFGIGGATAVFSVADALLLQPLPYTAPERLVALWERDRDQPRRPVSAANLVDYRQLDVFAALAVYQRTTLVVGGTELPEEVAAERVSADFFDVVGVRPQHGRLFTAADAEPGADAVVVVSAAFWLEHLGGDAAALGRPLLVNRAPRTIVGILPPQARALSDLTAAAPAAIFVPLPPISPLASRGDRDLRVVGRLAPGVSAERAQVALAQLSSHLAGEHPATNRDVSAALALLPQDVARTARMSLLVVLGAVALTVLIACVNVANLLLVWATGQQRDAAVRAALGATRGDIVTGHVVRGLAFGTAAAIVGIVTGVWVRDLLIAMAPAAVLPRVGPLALNGRVLSLALLLAFGTGLVASLAPALHLTRRRVASVLRDAAGSVAGARATMRWRGVLLMAEVASAVVLALGAGLLVRSLVLLDGVDLGFSTDRVATMVVRLPASTYPNADARLQFFEALRPRLAALPGVEGVAYANQFPMRGGWGGGLLVETIRGPVEGDVDLQAVSPDYFSTLGMTLRRGRTFTASDRGAAPAVAVVSETFVRRFLAEEEPLGRVIRRDATSAAITIVGVVAEVRRDGKFVDAVPQVYLAAMQPALYSTELSALAVRSAGEPLAVVPQVRQAVASLDPDLVVGGVRTLDEILDASIAPLRFHTWLLTLLGALAVGLALVGVYGVVNYAVMQRTREIGLRLALGATRGQVLRVVIGSGLRWVAAGIAIGLAGAGVSSRVLSSLLFETAPHDAATFAVVAAIVGGVAFIAAWVPARRAIAGDPVAALRGD